MHTNTVETRLSEVRKAIDKIVKGGQIVRYGERQVTRADLKLLRELEAQYAAEAENNAKPPRGRNRIGYFRI
ncbi:MULTISPECIES: hypothetical protein [unclassified Pseudomonas]|jgi:hypothetical protein|uniref:hypothetical protein n=1 Tax=unclassified Pseudomonas TaxID=196821 RepID=UPI001C60D403|nr:MULTISPECIES: hypothetical protein [unclassified Pseudomonas]MBW5416119.1 hypothetical protein [Pseudomonas sp. MAG002Y]